MEGKYPPIGSSSISIIPNFPLQNQAVGILKSHLKTLEDALKNGNFEINNEYINGLKLAISILEDAYPVIKFNDERIKK